LTSDGERGLGRHTSRIVINNCPSVLLTNFSLVQMDGLISVDLVNVANLTLMHHSFKLSQKAANTRITLRNSSVDVLPSNVFHGDVEAIVLENVRIGQVLAFAFANLINTNSITLENCQIKVIEALAFKKFDVRFFHMIGGTFGDQVPSRVMNDIEVYDKFMLDGVKMGIVRSSAFVIKRPKTVAILNCAIDNLESEAFDISVRGTVIIKNNTLGNVAFGAFFSIRADTENRIPSSSTNLYTLMFKNNSLNSFEEGSLIFDRTSFRTEINSVLVNQVCDCNQLSIWKSQILNYTNAYSRLMTSRDNANVLAPPFSLESSVEDPETFLCLENLDAESTSSFVEFETRNCAFSSSMLLLISAACGLLLLLIIASCLVAYYCRKHRRDGRKRWISVPTLAPDVVTKTQNGVIINRESTASGGAPVDSRITMVVPDGRLYKETEFHVIVEKAEPLTTEL
jgi:hypothetical protein